MTTQKQIILRLLRNWTSPMQALRAGAGMKLASRVSELRRDGHKIDDLWMAGRACKMYRLRRKA